MTEDEIFAVVGEDGFTRLVAAFYRQIPVDDILGPLYPPRDLFAAEERLRDFLIFRFGGSMRYIERRGHPRLGMRHARFPIDAAARDRWLQLMEAAFAEAEIAPEAVAVLRPFFEGTARFLQNVPESS